MRPKHWLARRLAQSLSGFNDPLGSTSSRRIGAATASRTDARVTNVKSITLYCSETI
jgi:hypothetical protein